MGALTGAQNPYPGSWQTFTTNSATLNPAVYVSAAQALAGNAA